MHGRYKKIGQWLKLVRLRPRAILGIDITSTAVKVLALSKKDNIFSLEHYGSELLPEDAMDGIFIKNAEVVANSIQTLLNKLEITDKQVALAIPDSTIISKIIQLPAQLSDEEMEELVLIEAGKYLPYSVAELYLDFEIIGESTVFPDMLDILIVGAREHCVNNRLKAVSYAGLEAVIVDVESYAVERAMQHFIKQLPTILAVKTIAIIDLDATYTRLFILHQMRLTYSREEQFDGQQSIEAIAESYHLTYAEALQAIQQGQLPEDYSEQILEPFKTKIIVHIRRALHFFYSSEQEQLIEQIGLAGEFAKLPGLTDCIQQQLAVPTTVIDPCSIINLQKNMSSAITIHGESLSLVACGLALRAIG